MNILRNSMEVGTRVAMPQNQVSSIIHTSGCIFNIETKKDET